MVNWVVMEPSEAFERGTYSSTSFWLITTPALGVVITTVLFGRVIDKKGPYWVAFLGLLCYGGGLLLCAAAVVSFAAPDSGGLNTNGLYRISRNPMYLAYFVCFLGMALLTRSPALLGLTLVFQASAHWIILAEERWCLEQFGQAYGQYMARVRRYL